MGKKGGKVVDEVLGLAVNRLPQQNQAVIFILGLFSLYNVYASATRDGPRGWSAAE
jgi:hypothetical protein